MGLEQQSTHKQIGAKVEQLSPESDSDSNVFGEFALKSTMAGLGMLAQARMEVGRADDPAEVEADAMALDFLRWQQSAGQQSAPAHEHISSGQTSRSSSSGTMETGGFAVGGDVESEISRETGRGSGLDGSTRGQFEGFFGVDLGGVRLHADSKAAELSRSLGAEAFTVGSDVFFGEGRFAPGSSSGMGLLAHELTHVVQQGGSSMRRVDPNAVAVSRSPLAGLHTISRVTTVDQSDSKRLDNGQNGFFSQAEQVTGTAASASAMQEFSKPLDFRASGPVKADDPSGELHGESLALISSTMNTVSSIEKLWEVFSEPSTTEEKAWTVLGGLKAAADLSKSAFEVSKAASIGAAVIPGIGVAISVMSFADKLWNTFLPLLEARKSEKVVLDSLRSKVAGTADLAAKKDLSLQIASMETLVSTSGREIGFAVVDMAADLTMVVGQLAQIFSGPFGTAVTLLGATLSLASMATKTVWEWISSHKAAKSREAEKTAKGVLDGSRTEFEEASQKATGAGATDDDRKKLTEAKDELKAKEDAYDDAYLALVQSDANSAFQNVLKMAFAPLRDAANPGSIDPTIRAMLTTLGISEHFIASTSAAIKSDPTAEIEYKVAVAEVAAIVSLGEPMTMMARIKSWKDGLIGSFGKVTAWFGRLFNTEASRMKAADVTEEGIKNEIEPIIGIASKYVAKKAKPGTGGVKPEVLTEYLQKPYKSVLARILVANPDATAVLAIMKVVLTDSLKDALNGAKLGVSLINTATVNVVVTQTSVAVTYDPFPVPAAAAAQPAVTTTAPAAVPVVPANTGTTI